MKNRHTLAACAAAFLLVLGGTTAALAQDTSPASDAEAAAAAPAPASVHGIASEQASLVPHAPQFYSAEALPPVYAPGPGYGNFTRAPKQRICYSTAPTSCGASRYLPCGAPVVAAGLVTLGIWAVVF